MTEIQLNHLLKINKTLNHFTRFILFFLASAMVAAHADNMVYSITDLPESYRTPLSESLYNDNQWRTKPEEDNPWRENKEEFEIKPRIKTELFPKYDYETIDNPNMRSLIQNEYELERPRTNIYRYTF